MQNEPITSRIYDELAHSQSPFFPFAIAHLPERQDSFVFGPACATRYERPFIDALYTPFPGGRMDAVVRSLRFRAMRVLALSLRTESLDPGGRQGLWITFGAILNPLLRKPQANAAAAYFQLMLDAWNVSLSINLPANGIDLASNVLTDPQNPLLQSAILANLAAAAASVNPRGDLDSQPYRSTTNTPWLFRAFSGLKSRFGRSQPPSAVLYPSDANLAQLSIAALLCAFPAPVARRGITVVINPRQVLTPALGQVWMLPVNLGTHQIKHVSFNRHADLPLINIS